MSEKQKRIIFAVCLVCAALLLIVPAIFAAIPPEPDEYTSVHTMQSLPTLMMLSADSFLNTADVVALDDLPGVGPVIAQRIVDMRALIGAFKFPEDLIMVKGIGDKSLAKIMDWLNEPLVEFVRPSEPQRIPVLE